MKQITVRDEFENAYTLCFTKETVKMTEARGFSLAKIDDQGNTMIDLLWEGAFLANHKNTKVSTIHKIWDSLADKEALLTKLVEMFNEQAEAILLPGEQKWEANW